MCKIALHGFIFPMWIGLVYCFSGFVGVQRKKQDDEKRPHESDDFMSKKVWESVEKPWVIISVALLFLATRFSLHWVCKRVLKFAFTIMWSTARARNVSFGQVNRFCELTSQSTLARFSDVLYAVCIYFCVFDLFQR